MPGRYLRDGVLSSAKMAKLTHPASNFWYKLLSIVDDYGRYELRIIPIKNNTFQAQDNVTEKEIIAWLKELIIAKLVERFDDTTGKKCFELLTFRQQFRSKSKYPRKNDEQMLKDEQPKAWKRIYAVKI